MRRAGVTLTRYTQRQLKLGVRMRWKWALGFASQTRAPHTHAGTRPVTWPGSGSFRPGWCTQMYYWPLARGLSRRAHRCADSANHAERILLLLCMCADAAFLRILPDIGEFQTCPECDVTLALRKMSMSKNGKSSRFFQRAAAMNATRISCVWGRNRI